ncbi:MAG: ATP synthase F1 subunit epsilon [Leptospira sp.]|nr:ATP synthase F1 subunit epsilon [Leptospira sp.]
MAVDKISVTVISPEKVIYKGEADYLRVPGIMGSFGILSNHAPIISELDIGILEITNSGNKVEMVLDGGFIEVKSNIVNILTNGGDLRQNIDLSDAQSALKIIMEEPTSGSDRALELKKAKVRILIHQN